MPIADHALVEREGFRVPLIGVAPAAMLQECDCCHDEFPLREVALAESGQLLCGKCRAENILKS
jgi:hypothetical protein